MKRIFLAALVFCTPLLAASQNITGLWKGTLYNDSTKQTLPYEIFISSENGKLTGYSHSWFAVDGKKYFGIKKVKVRVAKDGKIIVQDDALLVNDYPQTDKNVYQLNVLTIVTKNDETVLEGPFVTNRTKQYSELTGQINLKKAAADAESALMNFLQRSSADNGIAATK
jgi:hypothetical protein